MFVVQQASLGDAATQVLMVSQVFNNATDEGASFLQYDAEECESGLDAFFHDMSNTERKGNWLRTWWGNVLLPWHTADPALVHAHPNYTSVALHRNSVQLPST